MVKLTDVHTEHCCSGYEDHEANLAILIELENLISELFNNSEDDWCATPDIALAIGYRKVL